MVLKHRIFRMTLPLVVSACIALAACSDSSDIKGVFDPHNNDFFDKKQSLSRDDYRSMQKQPLRDGAKLKPYYEGGPEAKAELAPPPVPPISQLLAAPRPPKIGESQLVSIFVTEDVPIKDVLIELSRMADVDVEIDPAIQGGIIFRAQNKPFNQVIERIAKLAGLRYNMENGVLRVERDTEYVKTYPLDFLTFSRSSTSSIDVSTSVTSEGETGGQSGGSGASVSYEAAADFWQQLQVAVESILAYQPETGVAASVDRAAAAAGRASSGGDSSESFYVINRQAGSLTVSGTQRQHEQIDTYIRQMSYATSQQVLIEAKIIEVTLDEQFHSGISWDKVFSSSEGFLDVDYGSVPVVDGLTQLVIGADTTDSPSLDAIVNLTELFGTTRTLSSPRLHAMNNQQAILTFAQNLVYFEITVERNDETTATGASSDDFTVSSEIKTIPEGIVLTLLPNINPRTNEVTLGIRPTITRSVSTVEDPTIAFLLAQAGSDLQISNSVPVVETRELDSVMKLKSGEVMVLGGMMQQTGGNEQNGVPGLGGVPWIGNAFKSVSRREQVTELFFLIKATIIGNRGTADAADRNIYHKFTTDHRPLAF